MPLEFLTGAQVAGYGRFDGVPSRAGLGDSAMVNWRASYIRWALSISLGVTFGLRPPVRPRTRAAASPAWAGVTPMTIYRNITTVQTTAN
jgi:hypothetical protein